MCPEIVARSPGWYTYARREPEKTALFQVLQEHLLTFEQEWTDKSDGRTLPSFVTDELRYFILNESATTKAHESCNLPLLLPTH